MTHHELQPHQAGNGDPTAYERKLAGAIEQVFGSGTHDLAGLVTGLNTMGVAAPDGSPWTETSFADEMTRLGA
jgi:hypothetical protein